MRIPGLSASALFSAVAILLLPACHRTRDTTATANPAAPDNATGFSMNVSDDDGTVAMTGTGSGISVDAPGFSGNLKIPGLRLGGAQMSIDGMRPFPGTTFTNVNVDARDSAGGEDRGAVKMGFAAPGAPADILAYYADAARKAGYSTVGVTGGAVSGTKPDGSRFSVSAASSGTGSTGTLEVSDRDRR